MLDICTYAPMWKWKPFFDLTVDKWPEIEEITELKGYFGNIPFENGK